MQGWVLGLYHDFSCLAERCQATCCAGWRIAVDRKDYERFRQIEQPALREDILSHLEEQDGAYYFRTDKMGRCAMLDEDGLCRIQRNSSEKTLCNTCRKFPRLTAQVGQQLWLSMAASCPVVAEYLLREPVQWYAIEETGNALSMPELLVWRESIAYLKDRFPEHGQEAPRLSFDTFVDMAMDCLDIVLCFPECPYLEDSFDFYQREGDQSEVMSAFEKDTRTQWSFFFDNYINYRIPSRYLEYPREPVEHRSLQIVGELFLLRVLLCSRYQIRGGLKEQDWIECMVWLYRFCAHGRQMGERIHTLFVNRESGVLEQAFPMK